MTRALISAALLLAVSSCASLMESPQPAASPPSSDPAPAMVNGDPNPPPGEVAPVAQELPPPPPSHQWRTITLDGEAISEEFAGELVSWECHTFFDPAEVVVEMGHFTMEEASDFGFVLYDGTDIGTATTYERAGLERRWDWGPNGVEYAIVLKPTGSAAYYDFSDVGPGVSTEPSGIYMCEKRG